MTPERWQQVERIYHAALAAGADARGALLDSLCAGDAELRREVVSLLEQRSGAQHFLSEPAIVGAALGSPAHAYALAPDTVIGAYRIIEPLGSGGMGDVYRARDRHLERDVAIKVLPSHFTADAERRARFSREARLLATLNHPHIGAIYGLEEADGVAVLILELIEGPTLGDRIRRGPLPIDEALAIARQVAQALAAAHQQGIVHRDLKPDNIVLQGGAAGAEVRAKVLDFGLAKIVAADEDPGPPGSAAHPATVEGRILGTPAYMSPEQARGDKVDRRTDVWAFGCVLFEMLSGVRPFGGDTPGDTLARVLEREPDWTSLPARTPAAIRTLLERCLRKDSGQRLHDIADARIELDDEMRRALAGAGTGDSGQPARRRLAPLIWTLVGVLVLASAGIAMIKRRQAPSGAPERVAFPIGPPAGSRFVGTSPEFAIAPDGKAIAFVAAARQGAMLWVQSLSSPEPRVLKGTERARNPFWSADGQSIGFFADGKLQTIQVNGGTPVILCPAAGTAYALGPSGTWGSRDVIVFTERRRGLLQVPAKGGTPAPVAGLPVAGAAHLWPAFLPDGEHFLYSAQRGAVNELRVGSLTSVDSVVLAAVESQGAYADGHVFFVRGGNLMAQRFDADAVRLIDAPLRLDAPTGVDPPWRRGVFTISTNGRLAYRSTARTLSQLTWMDRLGRPVRSFGEPQVILGVNLSPDERRVALARLTQRTGVSADIDIWVIDLASGRTLRLADDTGWEFDPAWSHDGTRLAYNGQRAGLAAPYSLFTRASDGSGDSVEVMKGMPASGIAAPDWSPDDILVYSNGAGTDSDRSLDLWTLPLSGSGQPTAFLSTSYDESAPAFSADGRWLAYQSDTSGRREVYIRPFPARDPLHPISLDGGGSPRWRRDGRELFFLSADGALMAARLDLAKGLTAAVPERLFQTDLWPGSNRPYAVAMDGQHFLIPVASPQPLTIVLDWHSLLVR